jgi:hypothetical protein
MRELGFRPAPHTRGMEEEEPIKNLGTGGGNHEEDKGSEEKREKNNITSFHVDVYSRSDLSSGDV